MTLEQPDRINLTLSEDVPRSAFWDWEQNPDGPVAPSAFTFGVPQSFLLLLLFLDPSETIIPELAMPALLTRSDSSSVFDWAAHAHSRVSEALALSSPRKYSSEPDFVVVDGAFKCL